jgi:hypothetical protein
MPLYHLYLFSFPGLGADNEILHRQSFYNEKLRYLMTSILHIVKVTVEFIAVEAVTVTSGKNVITNPEDKIRWFNYGEIAIKFNICTRDLRV